jgi:chromosome segregation ATPase
MSFLGNLSTQEAATMNEDPTKKFSDGESFEARVLSELSAIRAGQAEIHTEQAEIRRELAEMRAEQAEMRKAIAALDSRVGSVEERLTSLEDKVDARLRETRPIWEAVSEDIRRLDRKFDEVIKDLYEVRADYSSYEKRLSQYEKRLSGLEDVR